MKKENYKEFPDLSYGPGGQQTFDLYLPTDRGDSPGLILYIHGGAWTSGDKAVYQEGILDVSVAVLERALNRVFDDLYSQSMPYIFGRIPGFWAMIPAENYEFVRDTFAAGVVTDEFYEKVEYYHTVQSQLTQTIAALSDEGLHLSVIAKYGYPLAPIVESRTEESDFVVELRYASLGATCCDYDQTFPADYEQQAFGDLNYISPDRKIDASTCAFPERTWFIKNSSHLGTLTGDTSRENDLMQWLLTSETQPTVWDRAEYPQFMSYFADGSFGPLTAENNLVVAGRFREKG